MSEFLRQTDLTYLQFRAEHNPVPIVSDIEQLNDIVELRVKPGLDALYDGWQSSSEVAYAGYSLSTYFHPHQRPEFKYPQGVAELREALRAMGAAVDNTPHLNNQDFHIELGDCFDARALKRKYRREHEGRSRQRYFKEIGHILGPVIRLQTTLASMGGDAFNQPKNIIFSTRHAVLIPGEVLLTGLYTMDPKLQEGYAILESEPPEYLNTVFDLQPKNTSYQDAIESAHNP